MRFLESEREVLEPFLKDPNYIKPRNRWAAVRYVRRVWEASAALTATVETVASSMGVTLAPEDEGFIEDQIVKGREDYYLDYHDLTRKFVLDFRAQRVPYFVTEDAIAGSSWETPINQTPLEPRMVRLGAIVDNIEQVGREIPRKAA